MTYVLILLTLIIGLVGVFTKTRDKVNGNAQEHATGWGWFVAFILIVVGIISALVEFDKANKEIKELKEQKEQLARENQIRDELLKDLSIVKRDLASSLEGLDLNLNTLKSAEKNLKKSSQLQLAQQTRMSTAIREFELEVNRGIVRLSSPLGELRFSLALHYQSAKETDSEALKIFKPLYIKGDEYGILGGVSNVYFHKGPGNFILSSVSVAIFETEADATSNVKIPALSYDLRIGQFYEKPPIFYSDIENNVFRGLFNLIPSDLVNNDLSYSSLLDILDNANKDAVALVSVTSGYPNGLALKELKFHSGESEYVGGKVIGCKLLSQNQFLKIITENREPVLTPTTYRFICPLNNVKKLARPY